VGSIAPRSSGRLFARLRRPTAREKVDGYRLKGPCGAIALLPAVGQGASLRQEGIFFSS